MKATEEIGQILKNWAENIIIGIVDVPEKVCVTTYQGDQTLVLTIHVDKSDVGKVLGKRGKNINAIRTLLAAQASRLQIRSVLEVEE